VILESKPHWIFSSAIFLLLIGGLATGTTIYKLYESERWVRHTFNVELTLATIESDLSLAGRSRTEFVYGGNPQALKGFVDGRAAALAALDRLRTMTNDNSEAQARIGQLESAMDGRLGAIEKSIEMTKAGNSDLVAQAALTANIAGWSAQTAAVSDQLKQSEEALLAQRTQITDRWFRLIATCLVLTFFLSVFLVWEHYRRLTGELRQRMVAERDAQNLSFQLLHAQDEERRRISRELHDGLGQNLSAAKMIAESFLKQPPDDASISELAGILDESLTSTRTMSYLLHPPLLDEIGLASAAEWFIEGFSKRTGIIVSFGIRGEKRRLPSAVELTLFRILQESLTNIQRHAQTTGAEVVLNFEDSRIGLEIEDHGVGIPVEKLKQFEKHGTTGVGLAGMKQRVQEQGGTFHLSSGSYGTIINVQLPAAS